MARLNTTTYEKRSVPNFEKVKSHIDGQVDTILEIGPGGVLKAFSKLLGGSLFGRLMKGIEQPLRRLSFLTLESFEPFEICEVFESFNPELTVVDIHDRVLDDINKKNQGRYNIKTALHNISLSAFPDKQFDLVVCNAVINWKSQNYEEMIDHVVDSIKVGGTLLITTPFIDYVEAKENLQKLEPWIFKKIA